jgi:hypothetical protein
MFYTLSVPADDTSTAASFSSACKGFSDDRKHECRITNLRQEITCDLRQALPHIPFPRHNLPSRWWILDTQANVLRDMLPVLCIEIFPYLTFF